MTHLETLRARALLLLASCLVAITAVSIVASGAQAAEPDGYGQLTRFGETGALGEAGKLAENQTRLLGVDSSQNCAAESGTVNCVYLLDEYAEPKETERFLRLQKFVAPPGTSAYALKASVEFTEKTPTLLSAEPVDEGLAIDPSEGRVYLLGVGAREKGLSIDKSAKEAPLTVASALFAFSTKESGSALVGAGTKGPHDEVLDEEAELLSQSTSPGKALLEPRGIAVDPLRHEVIVLAHVDKKGQSEDNIANDEYVLQRIEASGKLGEQYVDKTGFFNRKGIGFFKPQSPVVDVAKNAEGESEEHVDVLHVIEDAEDIDEVPTSPKTGQFELSSPPRTLAPAVEEGIDLGAFGSVSGAGGSLSAGPEGTIYGLGGIRNEAENGGGASSVDMLSPTGEKLGWSGGQLANAKTDACAIHEPVTEGLLPRTVSPSVAAGSGGRVFVLAPEFLERYEYEEEEFENPETEEEEVRLIPVPLEGPFFPAVIELGPGGSGCPQAIVPAPVASVNGIAVKGEEPIRPGTEVVLSSQIKQADALEVEWNFGDKTPPVTLKTHELEENHEYQTTTIKHKYEAVGKYKVTEKVRLDDLAGAAGAPGQPIWEGSFAGPTVTETQTVNINFPLPTAKLSGPASLKPGESATFDGSTSTDPSHSPIKKYVWSFGDGTTTETTTPTVSHAFASAGTYTVSLTVTDELGLTSSPAAVTVQVSSGSAGGGGGGGSSSGSSTTSTAPGGGSPGAGTGGGVLSYKVSLASTSITASAAGVLVLKVSCLGRSSCTGTVTLKTLNAVSAGAGHKKAVLTLASGTFRASGGTVKAVTLHLSAKGRALLAHSHVLRTRATIVARDSGGVAHTTPILVTLRLAKPKHH